MPSPTSESPAPLPFWLRALDALTVFFTALATYVLIVGGIVIEVAGQRVQSRSALKAFGEALIIALVRHSIRRRPSLWFRLRAWLSRAGEHTAAARAWALSRQGVIVLVAVALTTRLAVLHIGAEALQTMNYAPNNPTWHVSNDDFVNLPARWDSGWYLSIAQGGYTWDAGIRGQQNIVFFPAYPLTTRAIASAIFWNKTDVVRILWTGVVVSIAAFAGALVFLYKFARQYISEEDAIYAGVLIAAYPFAVFFSGMYTESFFLFFAIGTLYYFVRGDLWKAAALGYVAGLTRPNGYVMSVVLAVIALPALGGIFSAIAKWLPFMDRLPAPDVLRRKPLLAMIATIAMPTAGLLTYCGYIYHLTGDPFAWAHLLVYWGRDFHGLRLVNDGLNSISDHGIVNYAILQPIDFFNWLGLAFALVSLWPVTRRLGLAFGIFVAMNVLMPVASGGLVSIGRYSAALFPSFLWLSTATPKPMRPTLTLLFGLAQALAAAWFFTWREIY